MTKMKNKVIVVLLLLFAGAMSLYAQSETVCAKVQMQILQEATLERLAFDAQLKLSNNLSDYSLTDVRVDVSLADEDGGAVTELFFIKVNKMENIDSIAGDGVIAPVKQGVINWLIIPGRDAGGDTSTGKRYACKADIFYTVAGKQYNITTWEDWIRVLPEPRITLDYFIPQEVRGDNPLTEEIEPTVPFPLAVRVINTGYGTATNFRIESFQPEIINNEKGLLVDFEIIGSWINNQEAPQSLKIKFGDIAPQGGASVAYWQMEASLRGEFTEFKGSFMHSSDLGGEMTSLLDDVRTHWLVKDMICDLEGKDDIVDLLADSDMDGTVDLIYESEGIETEVHTSVSEIHGVPTPENLKVTLTANPVPGAWIYTAVSEPTGGTFKIGKVVRSDGKIINEQNWWQDENNFYLVDFDVKDEYVIYYTAESFDTEPPVTTLEIGEPKYGVAPVYVKSDTRFTLSASDAGGVEITRWRAVGGDWQTTTGFYLQTEGRQTIIYQSKDVIGNWEEEKALEVEVDNTAPASSVEFDGIYYAVPE